MIRTVALLLSVLFAFGCASDSPSRPTLVWASGEETPAPVPPPERRSADSNRVIKLSKEVMKELMETVNRPQILMADRIEVDASRIPFQMSMVQFVQPEYVEQVEMVSQGLKARGFLLRCRAERPQVERDFPRIRMGDGLELVAGREIQFRTWSEVDEDRPVFLCIQALGHATYRDEETGRRLRGERIVLKVEVHSSPGGYVVRRSLR